MKIKKLLIILIISSSLILTGCWGKKELSELAMVVAMAVDKDLKTGEFILISEVVRSSALKKETGTTESPVQLITTKGYTVFDAIRNGIKKLDRKQFFAHSKIIVINEMLAKEGIMGFLDMMSRSYEIRDSVWLVIAKGSTPKEILSYNRGLESIQGSYLNKIIAQQQYNPDGVSVDLLEFIKKAQGEGINPVIGTAQLEKEINTPIENAKQSTEKSISYEGLAVFKKDKLVGYINSDNTHGYNWIVGKVKSGIMNVSSPGDKGKLIALEIKKASTKISLQKKNGEMFFNIDIDVKSDVVEDQGTSNISKLEVMDVINKEQKKLVEKEVKLVIEKIQKEFNSDIFGWGIVYSKKYPQEWEKIKKNWDEIFSKVKYSINVNSDIDKTGVIKEPEKAPVK